MLASFEGNLSFLDRWFLKGKDYNAKEKEKEASIIVYRYIKIRALGKKVRCKTTLQKCLRYHFSVFVDM